MTTIITAGTISVVPGSTSVSGSGTAWALSNVEEGDLFTSGGSIGVVASVESDTAMTLATPWDGASLSVEQYAIRREYRRGDAIKANERLLEYIEELRSRTFARPDAYVTESSPLSSFDSEATGFTVLDLQATPPTIIVKKSVTAGDWTDPVNWLPAGPQGEQGFQGEPGTPGIVRSESSAYRFLGDKAGVAFDFITNSGAITGGVAATEGRADQIVSHTRDVSAYATGASGLIEKRDAGVPLFPAFSPRSGAIQGIRVDQQIEGQALDRQQFDASSYVLENGATVAVVPGKSGPVDGASVWRLSDTSSTAFSALRQQQLNVLSDSMVITDSVLMAKDSSDEVQLKIVMSGGTSITAVATFDLENGTVKSAVNCSAWIEPAGAGFFRGHATVANNATGNTHLTRRLIADLPDLSGTGAIFLVDWNWVLGAAPGPFRLSNDIILPPVLDSAKWNQFAGSTTIGSYGPGVNKLPTTDMTASGWTKSNVSVTTLTGAGVDGADAYRVQDTSGTGAGFILEDVTTGIGADDWVYVGKFIDISTYDGDGLRQRINFRAGSPNVLTDFTIDVATGELVSVSGDGAGSQRFDAVPVSGNLWFFIAWEQNNNSGNTIARDLVYPDLAGAGDGGVDISQPVMVTSPTEDKWSIDPFITVDEWTYESVDQTVFSSAFGTEIIDAFELPHLSTGQRVVLFEYGGGLGVIRMEIVESGGLSYLSLVIGDGATENVITSSAPVDLGPARWWVSWSASEVSAGRNGETFISDVAQSARPSGVTTLRLGSSSLGASAAGFNIGRAIYRAETMAAQTINELGRVDSFAPEAVMEQGLETLQARDALLARKRYSIFRLDTSSYPYIGASSAVSQSFPRGSSQSNPPYLNTAWRISMAGSTFLTPVQIGGSLRGAQTSGRVFVPVSDFDAIPGGAPGLNPMTSTTDKAGNVLSDAEIDAQAWTDHAGETPLAAMCFELTRLMNEARGLATSNVDNILLGGVTGSATDGSLAAVAGEDDASDSDVWAVHLDWMEQAETLTGGDGTLAIAVNMVGKGEAEYSAGASKDDFLIGKSNSGLDSTGIGFLAALDNVSSAAIAQTGQTFGPLNVGLCPSMQWMRDPATVGAALDYAEETREDFSLAAATYNGQPGSTGNQHSSSYLGAVLLGLHCARCAFTIAYEGKNYFIPKPYKAWRHGRTIHIGFLAMDYPMSLEQWFSATSTQLGYVENYGFVVEDVDERYTLARPPEVITAPLPGGGTVANIVRLELVSEPKRPVRVVYGGDDVSLGFGNLFDSGPDFEAWEYRHIGADDSSRDVKFYDGRKLPGMRACRNFSIDVI